jgi:acyl-CoA thioester hydrolase
MTDPRWQTETLIEIPFHDVDMMRIAWHGNYAKYFEIARCALLSEYDYDYQQMSDSGYAWPVIELHVRYARPLKFQQKIRVQARIVEYENRLKIAYEIRDHESGARLTRGHTVQVAVKMPEEEMCFYSPPILLQKLGVTAAG